MAKAPRKRGSSLMDSLQWTGFDVEAVGLMLLAVAILLGAAVYLPTKWIGLLVVLRTGLWGGIGWAALLLPVPFALVGLAMLLRSQLFVAGRLIAGLVVAVLGALVVTGVFRPEWAGLPGGLGLGLRRGLGWFLASLPGVFVVTLGLELMAALTPTTLLRWFVTGVALVLARLLQAFQTVFFGVRDGTNRFLRLRNLRNRLEAQRAGLGSLERFAPNPDLKQWRRETDARLNKLNDLDERGFEALDKELNALDKRLNAFAKDQSKTLVQQIKQDEDSGAANLIQEGLRVLAEPVKASNVAARQLENERSRLEFEFEKLEDTRNRLMRERDNALRNLAGGVEALPLAQEFEGFEARKEQHETLLERAERLLDACRHYPDWPEFVGRLDGVAVDASNENAASESKREDDRATLGLQLAQTMRKEHETIWPNVEDWVLKLEALENKDYRQELEEEATQAANEAAAHAVSKAAAHAVSKAAAHAAVQEPSTPPTPTSADVLADRLQHDLHTNANALEVVNIATQTAPDDNGLQWDNNDEDDQPNDQPSGLADSNVGERLKTSTTSPINAIPIAVPKPSHLDPLQVSLIDLVSLEREARARANTINETLSNFGIQAKVVDFARGPTVTRYELEPSPGEKIARIQNVQNDLARVLAVGGVRIEAPVPGKSVVGLEVPNAQREPVTFRAGIESQGFAKGKTKLPLLLGKSIDGEIIVGDLARMPHLLIAGSTGSGKSVCVNTLIMSLLFRYLPTQMRFVMVDPKMVELTPYDGIPHLVRPIVTNPSDAAGVLLGAVAHMERRYKMMFELGAKNLEQYNEKAREQQQPELPYLVIIIDELADLMITSPKEVEAALQRLAQMGRASGMHLILATQRPSADVVTGLIKVNVPARVAFAVSSGIDSRTILDSVGAERLTGYGDMLYYQPGLVKAMRLQGPYLSEGELGRITEFLRQQHFDDEFGEAYGTDFDGIFDTGAGGPINAADMDYSDPFLKRAAEVVVEEGYAAVSRLQRRLSVGHARAGKLIDLLEGMGIVGPHKGSKSREVLVTRDQLRDYFG